ncbi:MAG: heme ABC exporter ATP-binding protein CcmA [Desulfovibrionaceae bacterium]
MSASAPLLRLDRVAKFYGPKLVFKGVSLALAAGEVLLVAGANGAGKSTLLKVMAGLARPSAGSVRCAAEPERTAYLGHATFLYAGLTARANLRFWARMYGLPGDESSVDAALARVGLTAAAEERAGTFSRGMAQRLNLARVFLVGPRLVYLDEPSTGLDVASRRVLTRELAALKASGASIVWVSHHMAEDAALADRVLELAGGRAAWLGPTAEYPGLASAVPAGAEAAC